MYFPRTASMESAMRSILVDNMVNCLQSLFRQTRTTVTNVAAMGRESKKFLNLLRERISLDDDDDEELFIKDTLYGNKYQRDFKTDLIVIERDMDPITPLLTQLTYAGILDDLYEFADDGKLKGKNNVELDYRKDEIWEELKFLNFGAIGPQLNRRAKDLQNKYESRHSADSVGEIKQFVDSLGTLQERQKLLKAHTTLSTDVLNQVETDESLQFNSILELEQDFLLHNLDNRTSCESILEMIYEGDTDSTRILRLICLMSIVRISIRDKDFENFKKELIDTFGIEILFQLERLTQAGLFTSKSLLDSKQYNSKLLKEYRYISKWLDTLPNTDDQIPTAVGPHLDPSNPKEPTFAYCGVVPLTTRYIQMLYDRSVLSQNYSSQQPFIISRNPNLLGTHELLEQIYGNSDIFESGTWIPESRKKPSNGSKQKTNISGKEQNDIAIIVFLGGITMGEIATLKHLQNQLREKKIYKRFIIVSDGLTNGARMIGTSSFKRS